MSKLIKLDDGVYIKAGSLMCITRSSCHLVLNFLNGQKIELRFTTILLEKTKQYAERYNKEMENKKFTENDELRKTAQDMVVLTDNLD